MVRALEVFKDLKRGERDLDDLLDGTWIARDDLGRAVDAVADEPGSAGDVEVENAGGEPVGRARG